MTVGHIASFGSWIVRNGWPELAALILLPYVYIGFQRVLHRRQNELFRLISENAADMIALVEVTGKRLYNSPSYEKVLGYSARELAETASLEQVHPNDRGTLIEAGKQARLTGIGKRLEYRMRHKDGSWRVLESTANPIRNRKGQVTQLVIVNRDITERRRMQHQLEHNAYHDALTDLPNRTLFLDRLQRATDYAKRHPEFNFAVLFIDIQGLAIFNETMGHAVVDQLIIDISNRLRTHVRHDDLISRSSVSGDNSELAAVDDETLARMDGDQFTVLLEGIKEPSEPMRVALRVQECLAEPFTANGLDVFTFASIGIALSSSASQKPAEMLRDADIAMCRARAQGVSSCEVFDSNMHAMVVRRLNLESELRKAIDRDELRVLYQPIIHLATGRMAGVEALIRWCREGVLVAPVDFIDIAEDTGLIVPIGRWILREACRQAHEWHGGFRTDPLLTVTVNVSPRQFAQSNLVADVAAALQESRIDPWTLQLEITESAAMSDPQKALRIFSQLKDLGVRLSIDDFGTGHSSLSRLRGFPVDVLKIDRSFISGIEKDEDSREIAHLITTLAHHLDLKVIAEGIETAGQRVHLSQFGCEFGQGYLFSPPVDRFAIEAFLTTPAFEPAAQVVYR